MAIGHNLPEGIAIFLTTLQRTMYNLTTSDIVNDKFALLNSGNYLMDIEQVKDIITACEKYLENWGQADIDMYNKDLLLKRELENRDSTKYKQRLILEKKEREQKRFIYIILNNRNGFYKIGLSVNPIKRERTLQAEDPDIDIIETFKGGFEIENKIHTYFADKRVRGEWFKLDENDIEKIRNQFIQV